MFLYACIAVFVMRAIVVETENNKEFYIVFYCLGNKKKDFIKITIKN